MICECLMWLSLASYHLDRTQGYKEFNPGIILEQKDGPFLGGLYRNSYGKLTAFGARDFTLDRRVLFETVPARTSFAIGLVGGGGYRTPVLAVARVTFDKRVSLFGLVMPSKDDEKGKWRLNGAIGLTIGVN
jgi:hypothetical protein